MITPHSNKISQIIIVLMLWVSLECCVKTYKTQNTFPNIKYAANGYKNLILKSSVLNDLHE